MSIRNDRVIKFERKFVESELNSRKWFMSSFVIAKIVENQIKSNRKKKQKNSQKIKTTQTGKLCWQPNLFWMRAAPQEKSSRFFLHIVVVVALLSINGAAIGFSQSFHVNGKSRQTSNRSTVSSFWLWKAIFHFHLNLLTNHHPNTTTSLTKSKQPLYKMLDFLRSSSQSSTRSFTEMRALWWTTHPKN